MPVRTHNCLTKQNATLLCGHVSTNRTRQVRISRKERLYTSTPAFCNMAAHGGPHDSVQTPYVECVWNLMAHGDAREGNWRGNWWMEWVTSTLTLPRNVVYPALITLMRTPRLPAVDWTDDPPDLNGLVRFGERRNLVSARVPSRFKRTIPMSSLVSKYTVSGYKRKFNFVYAIRKVRLSLRPFSWNSQNAQENYVQTSFTEFHSRQKINTEK